MVDGEHQNQVDVIRVRLGGDEAAIDDQLTAQTGPAQKGEVLLQPDKEFGALIARLKAAEARGQFGHRAIVDAFGQKSVLI